MKKFKVNQPEKNKKYQSRAGAYALIIKDNLLAVVKTETGYFLPGGGLEKGESKKDCLIRECREEIGLEINIIKKLSQGLYYFFSTTKNIDMASLGHFYQVEIKKVLNIPTEKNHQLIWLKPSKAIELLFLENQKEAVRLFVK
ncbi:MAG: NUDIX domain-containing protein [Patescibacteria group bacterium]|nr:NUDIX domain-containing protein [Patescibacteria group bacterium]